MILNERPRLNLQMKKKIVFENEKTKKRKSEKRKKEKKIENEKRKLI